VGGQNPASSPVLAAGEGLGEGVRVTRGLFGSSARGERLPVGGRAGGQGRWPPRLPAPARGEMGGNKRTRELH
jgi:hypothetical protein